MAAVKFIKGNLMKKYAFLSLLLVSTTPYAFEVESCEAWQAKAATYMTWRQQGTPIAEAVGQTLGNRSRGLLLQAYQAPVESDFRVQYEVIENFSKGIYDDCSANE